MTQSTQTEHKDEQRRIAEDQRRADQRGQANAQASGKQDGPGADAHKPIVPTRTDDGSKPGAAPSNPIHQPSAHGNPGNIDDTPQQAPNMDASVEAQQKRAREERARNRMPEQKIDPLEDNPEYQRAVRDQPVGAGRDARPAHEVNPQPDPNRPMTAPGQPGTLPGQVPVGQHEHDAHADARRDTRRS